MSYCIRLKDPVTGDTLQSDSPHNIKGTIYKIGGSTDLELNVTANYSKYYNECSENGISSIYGLQGVDSIAVLSKMIETLKEKYPDMETSNNYWDSCPGNAVKPLYQLLAFAKMRPDGVWDGD